MKKLLAVLFSAIMILMAAGASSAEGNPGTVAKVNEALSDEPELMNKAPYEAWFVLAGDITGTEELMTAAEYEAFVASEG